MIIESSIPLINQLFMIQLAMIIESSPSISASPRWSHLFLGTCHAARPLRLPIIDLVKRTDQATAHCESDPWSEQNDGVKGG